MSDFKAVYVLNASDFPSGGGGATGSISAGTTKATLGEVVFSNSNGVSFGVNGQTVTASHNALTSQSNQAVSGQNGSSTFQTLSFGNANGISFGTDAAGFTASHNALTSQSNQNVTAGNGGFAFQTLSFSNVNGISFGTSAGSAITGSHNALTSQSNQAFSAGAASSTFQTLSFQDSNGLSFSNNAGAIRVSYTAPVVSNAIQSVGSATGSGTNTSRFAADDHVHAGVFSMGVSTMGNTAGDTRVDVGRFIFQGSNLTLSQLTAANALNTIIISAAAAGAAAITQSIGISTQTAGGATAGTSGYATGDDILYHFVPGSNITMSQSLNGASATLSIYGAAGGAGATLSGFNPYADGVKVAGQQGQGTLCIDPMRVGNAFQFDRILNVVNFTATSNSSGSMTVSFWNGLYTRNASTLSLLSSFSTSTNLTMSGTVGSYSLWSGQRMVSIPATMTLTVGDYWLACITRTTTGGAAGMTLSQQLGSNIASDFFGFFGQSNNTTRQLTLGQGVYTATTSAMPASIGFSQLRGSDSLARRAPFIMFASGTV